VLNFNHSSAGAPELRGFFSVIYLNILNFNHLRIVPVFGGFAA